MSACCGCCADNAWLLPDEPPALVQEHKSNGCFLTLKDGSRVFCRDQGRDTADSSRTAVVMVHGVPASSFLYRKFFAPLAAKGYRAVAMDLPGLGLSDKPLDRDYSWPALAASLGEVLEHADLELFTAANSKIHLVFHDIGGPIAALWASQHAHRVASITALDTMLDLERFRKPFPMNMFPLPLIGAISIATLTPWILRHFMYVRGVADTTACDHDESVAWVWLLKCNQGSQSFSKIMKSFPSTSADRTSFTQQIVDGLGKHDPVNDAQPSIPVQIVWAEGEVAIPQSQCQYIQDNFHVLATSKVPGRHFLQLESADIIVDKLHAFLQQQQQQQQAAPDGTQHTETKTQE